MSRENSTVNAAARPFSNRDFDPSRIMKPVLIILFLLIFGAFIFALFKNIQYPLIWNDEGETVMFAKHILQYGYPKIHDEKNIVWLNELQDKEFGRDPKTDAPVSLVWGQYYFAAIGAFFAEMTGDLYLKTALLRIPFALAGLTGLFIMALSVIGLFEKDIIKKLIFLIIFFGSALFCVPFILHLRQVRHPALIFFLPACILYVYFNFRFYNKIKPVTYFIATVLLSFLLYHVFHLVCFILFAAIVLYEGVVLLIKRKVRDFLITISPTIAASLLIAPFFFLSDVFKGGLVCKTYFHLPPLTAQVLDIIQFFQKFGFLHAAAAAKAVFLCMWGCLWMQRMKPAAAVKQKMGASLFLTLYFVIYVFAMGLFPAPIIFERYYTNLIPVLSIIFALDVFGTFELLSRISGIVIKNLARASFALILLITLPINSSYKIHHMVGYSYELTHPYKGPLDFVIPFIQSHYKNAEDLIIATNYEELCYMYYLGSKIIVGYVGNNLAEDMKMRPDVMVYRKKWTWVGNEPFNQFLRRYKYRRLLFPVFDYFVNNIPDSRWHLYITLLSNNENQQLDIFVRVPEDAS